MALTDRQLNRATLARQMLLAREPVSVGDAVRRVVAIQAQEPASPYIALWNRITAFDPAELDRAFSESAIVKASLMRITLHAVDVGDYPAFHAAITSTLRASRLHDRRFTSSGLSKDDADAIVPHLVEYASRPRSGAEIQAMLAERLGFTPDQGLWWALRTFAPLTHAPTGGPWSFGAKNAYVAPPVAPAGGDPLDSVQRLVWRYLEGFGPATPQDFAQFALLRQPSVKPAFDALSDKLRRIDGPSGPVFDVPDGLIPDGDTPAPPRLMAMWDSVLLAYVDRGRVIPPDYKPHVIRRNGDVLPTLLVDGYVAGVWRPVADGIEATAFHALDTATWKALASEAKAMLALLAGRQPAVYSRYGRWWESLPAGDVRILVA